MRALLGSLTLSTLALTTLGVAAPEQRARCRTEPYPGEGASPLPREFYYTRGIYQGTRCDNWTTDYPKADRQFLMGVRRLLSSLDSYDGEHPVRLDDTNLSRYPFLYMVEVGHTAMTPSEMAGLRRYLLAGGFLVVDDFWGTYEWQVWESQIKQVLPEYPIVELPRDHPIFNTVYTINEIVQVPNIGNAQPGRHTWEQDGYIPHCRGIFGKDGRLMVVINWNTDLGDAFEWAESPYYPLKYSTFAYQMGMNFIVYAMSH